MKKYLLLLLLCVASANLMAQSIPSDSKWYDGWNNYVASDWDEGSVLMQVIAEGEKLEFILVPVEGEEDCYILEKSPDADAVLSYPVGLVVKRARGDGLEVLCLFDGNDRLVGVMSKTRIPARVVSALNMNTRLKGSYKVDSTGDSIVIDDGVGLFNGKKVYFKMDSFNDMATGVLKIDTGSPLEGSWEFVPTLSGFKVYPGSFGQNATFRRTGEPFILVDADPGSGRFEFASKILLDNACLKSYKKSTLRLMRSEILARHGYVFEDEDLKEYFRKQPWYKPAQSNEGIELSFIEKLNVGLIENAESDPEHDTYVDE
ncbi:MAG: YARHG domain-containing protein [Bacteroidales bacterium]|nr:YARHG domain-containing protein [Bacteroidales bacterium]